MITSSMIAWGDQLGAQLTKLAQLHYIAKKNGQELVLYEELRDLRRGYQFLDVFEIPEFVSLISRCSHFKKGLVQMYCQRFNVRQQNWKTGMKRIYGSRSRRYLDRSVYELVRLDYRDFIRIKNCADGVHTDENLLSLDNDKNYDIHSGFGTFRDWGEYRQDIISGLIFKEQIIKSGKGICSKWKASAKKRVSVHIRRTDYVILSSLNLTDDYYNAAFDHFPENEWQYIVFSDDIEYCMNSHLFKDKDCVFVIGNTAGVDMFLMTMCKGNIIANSSFSFWGALLNIHSNAKVVCPHDYIGETSKEALYINGNYYPDEWIAI